MIKNENKNLIEDYKKQFLRVNGRNATVGYYKGWFYVNGITFRKTELENALNVLKISKDYNFPK